MESIQTSNADCLNSLNSQTGQSKLVIKLIWKYKDTIYYSDRDC